MKRVLLVLLLLAVGCGTLNVPVALSSTGLEEQGCKLIERKQIFDPVGPKSLNSAIEDEVHRVGGNLVVMTGKQSGFMTEYAFVEIWFCPTPQGVSANAVPAIPATKTLTSPNAAALESIRAEVDAEMVLLGARGQVTEDKEFLRLRSPEIRKEFFQYLLDTNASVDRVRDRDYLAGQWRIFVRVRGTVPPTPTAIPAAEGALNTQVTAKQGTPAVTASQTSLELKGRILSLMAEAMSIDIIISYVQTQALPAPLSAEELVEWKKAGIPESVIKVAIDQSKKR